MTIVSSFTHPLFVQNLFDFLYSIEHIDFFSIFPPYSGKMGASNQFWGELLH